MLKRSIWKVFFLQEKNQQKHIKNIIIIIKNNLK